MFKAPNIFLAITTIFFSAITIQADDNIEWPAYGGSAGGGHYSRATEITKNNVADLAQAWQHRSGDFRQGNNALFDESGNDDAQSPTAFAVTPLMVEEDNVLVTDRVDAYVRLLRLLMRKERLDYKCLQFSGSLCYLHVHSHLLSHPCLYFSK